MIKNWVFRKSDNFFGLEPNQQPETKNQKHIYGKRW